MLASHRLYILTTIYLFIHKMSQYTVQRSTYNWCRQHFRSVTLVCAVFIVHSPVIFSLISHGQQILVVSKKCQVKCSTRPNISFIMYYFLYICQVYFLFLICVKEDRSVTLAGTFIINICLSLKFLALSNYYWWLHVLI